MILDYENLFSEDQAITATAASTNVIDTESARNLGVGEPLGLFLMVTADFDNLTSLEIQFQTDSAEGFGTVETLFEVSVALADLVEGYKLPVMYVPADTKRYVRLNYSVTGTNPTSGTITAGLVLNQDRWKAYPGVVG